MIKLPEIKEIVARESGFDPVICNSSWRWAMMVTKRTNSQLRLYEKVIDRLIIEYEKLLSDKNKTL